MDLKELNSHSKALSKAERIGITCLTGQSFHLEKEMFLDIVTNHELNVEKVFTKSGNYHLSFWLNGYEYITFVTAQEHQEAFEGHKKMTS
ncbi:hypothetical protein ACLIBH_07390 [Virgibacillus sp. W0430]|uniref:hypothetical protein n=1 Tax=Virgibacillus sp. W0430 TaxID=3391580 RepID=UPI003F488505